MANRWIKKIKKDLLANPASTAALVQGRIGGGDGRTQRMLWALTTGPEPSVTASGALDNAATTYTWVDEPS